MKDSVSGLYLRSQTYLEYILFFYLMIILVFQNILAIFLSSFVNVKKVILIKDIFIFLLLLMGVTVFVSRICLTFKIHLKKIDYLMIFYSLWCITYFFLPMGSNSFAKLISLRQLLSFPVFYFIGRIFGDLNLFHLNKILYFFGILVAGFGFFEFFFLKDLFWIHLGIYQFMVDKGMERWAYGPGGVPGNFYTYDFINILGYPLRRNVTLLAEPTLSGHFLSYLVISSLVLRDFLPFLFFFFALLLTLSKGGLFVAITSIFFLVLKKKGKRFLVFGTILFLLLLSGVVFVMYNLSPSVKNHFFGLMYNLYILILNPIGYGLGTSGNYSKLFSGIHEGSGESFFGALVSQLGIISGLFYISIMIEVFRLFLRASSKLENVVYVVTFATLLAAFLSESAISYVGSGYIFLLMGVAVSRNIPLKESKGEKT